MRKQRDFRNQKFGRLVAILPTLNRTKGGNIIWWAKCDCGEYLLVSANDLIYGTTKSCGCLQKEIIRTIFAIHNSSRKNKTYKSWQSMKSRCSNSKLKHYKYYGGRGITVCQEWMDFRNFLRDMGERPEGMSIDRYPNNNGNYEPSNCRWATPKEQANNRCKEVD